MTVPPNATLIRRNAPLAAAVASFAIGLFAGYKYAETRLPVMIIADADGTLIGWE